MQETSNLHVSLGQRSYDIIVGEQLLENAGLHILPLLNSANVIIVTDTTVEIACLPSLIKGLEAHGISSRIISVPAGEQSKSFSQLQDLTGNLLENGIDRKTTLIALGGGVIGDLTGFAAAITMRGIPFIQIPTTLLSQVDSSVGGKTGINTPFGKNLIGAFHQPRLVLADVGLLSSLPKRHLLAGYGETVKYGLINDPAFFEWCEQNGPAVISGNNTSARIHAVMTSCAIKAAIVAEDEREAGNRALLNLGHTFGHAFEAETGFGDTLLHGEAVAIGTIMAFDLSVRMGLCAPEDARRVRSHFESVGLPTTLKGLTNSNWSVDKLLDHMGHDKKTESGQLTLILTRGIGQSFVNRAIDQNELKNVLKDALLQS